MIKVIHYVPTVDPSDGGPSVSVPALCRALGDENVDVSLLFGQGDVFLPKASSAPDFQPSAKPLPILWRAMMLARRLAHLLATDRPKALHVHGVWHPLGAVACMVARFRKTPYVVTPRGMLEPWALNYKSGKKKIAWRLYQRWILEQASFLVATSEMEASSIRALLPDVEVRVIPNGVDVPVVPEGVPYGSKTPRTALFLSRLDPKKGADILIDAWCTVAPDKWRLVIAGPGDPEYVASLKEKVARKGDDARITLLGPVYGDEKESLFAAASLFVLPTHSENFGNVIAEALARSIPVVTTKGAPWAIIASEKCGWWIETGVEPLIECLSAAVQETSEALSERGRRGRVLMQEKFSWPAAAQAHAVLYGVLPVVVSR